MNPSKTSNPTATESPLNAAPDAILASIASQFFGTEILATRNSDALDFYDVAVWNLKAALEAAYCAGRHSAEETSAG